MAPYVDSPSPFLRKCLKFAGKGSRTLTTGIVTYTTLWGGNLLIRFFVKKCPRVPQAVGVYCSCHGAQGSQGNSLKTYNKTFSTSCRPRLSLCFGQHSIPKLTKGLCKIMTPFKTHAWIHFSLRAAFFGTFFGRQWRCRMVGPQTMHVRGVAVLRCISFLWVYSERLVLKTLLHSLHNMP